MKNALTFTLCLVMIVFLSACGHQHDWQEATCSSPKVCTECGVTEGEALPHTWKDATCEEPRTCSICGIEQGEPNGHDWQEATCQHPEQCAVCSSTRNSILGDHTCNSWMEIVDPTCTSEGYKKGTCVNCGQEFTVILEMVAHNFGEWETVKETSCIESGEKKQTCIDCGYEITEEVPIIEHNLGEWAISKNAVYNENGVKEQKCTSCYNVINTEEFSFADTIKEKVEFKGYTDGLVATDAQIIYSNSWGYINAQAIIEITNNNDSSVRIGKANVDIVDNDSVMIDTVDEYSLYFVPAIIEAGQKGYILAEIFKPTDELDISNGIDVKAFLTVEETKESRSQWEFTDVNTKGYDPSTVGHVRNAGNITYIYFDVYCLYRDVTGRVIGFTKAQSNNEIAPDETVSFGTNNYYTGLINGSNIVDVECVGIGYF